MTIPDRPIGWIALNSTWEKMLLYELVLLIRNIDYCIVKNYK